MFDYKSILLTSKAKHKEIMKRMRYLSKLSSPNFDKEVHSYHEEVFSKIDCTKCGLCCKSMGPIFRNMDIKHICAAIGTPPKAFMAEFLEQDPDGVGYMLKKLPCPFQNEDNTCSVYEERTLSCVNFPHTLEKNIQRRLVGLALDSLHCPAAFMICEKIIAKF